MLTLPVIAVTRLAHRQMGAISRRAARVISSDGWFVLRSRRLRIELGSVTRVMMRLKNWLVLPATRSGQGYHGAGKCQHLCLLIITRRSLLPVAQAATTASVLLAAMTFQPVSDAIRVRLGVFEIVVVESFADRA